MITELLALTIFALSATKTMAADFVQSDKIVLAERSFSLNDRYGNDFVNDVFKDNILLTLSYMNGQVPDSRKIDWSSVDKPKSYSMILNPGEMFAFHEDILPEYTGKTIKTMQAHFNSTDGFKSDGYLTGDGVCHLASLMYWAAKNAGLATLAPTNHNFARIPDVPAEYGVAIYFNPGSPETNAKENLYITNTLDKPVQFAFTFDGNNLTVKVVE